MHSIKFNKSAIFESPEKVIMGFELEFYDSQNPNNEWFGTYFYEYASYPEIVERLKSHPMVRDYRTDGAYSKLYTQEGREALIQNLYDDFNLPYTNDQHAIVEMVNCIEAKTGIIIDGVAVNDVVEEFEHWGVEVSEDCSIELKSAPMDAEVAIPQLRNVLENLQYRFYSTDINAFQVNISLKDRNILDVDWTKAIILFNEKYYLNYYSRKDNHNAAPILDRKFNNVEEIRQYVREKMNMYKCTSFCLREGSYVECRIAGNERYMCDVEGTVRFASRLAHVVQSSISHYTYESIYTKRLAKLFNRTPESVIAA